MAGAVVGSAEHRTERMNGGSARHSGAGAWRRGRDGRRAPALGATQLRAGPLLPEPFDGHRSTPKPMSLF